MPCDCAGSNSAPKVLDFPPSLKSQTTDFGVGSDSSQLSDSVNHAFVALDSQLLVSVDGAHPKAQQLAMTSSDEGITNEDYEPYSDELDSFVTASGMPDPLDDDSVTHQRYAYWLQNYKRIPNEPKVLWSYDNADSAPDVWASLDKDYMLCDPDLTKGKGSPIDIETSSAQHACYGPSFPHQQALWDSTPATLSEMFDRSFIVDVANCRKGEGCQSAPTVPAGGDHAEMVLERIVFHTPSEHKLNGQTFDMELQFMHCRAGATFFPGCKPEMAYAVFLQDGGASQADPDFISKLAMTVKDVGNAPKELAKGLKFQSVADVISPLLREFYMYEGTTTYPPCYQGVQWYIPTQALMVSSSIIAAFKAREGENVRPTFALGKRSLELLRPEAADHWTYRGPRGYDRWGTSLFPWLPFTSCGKKEDCESLGDQESRDRCLADQAVQSPVDILTNVCNPYFEDGKACSKDGGLAPLAWNTGRSKTQPIKMYLKDCGPCKPCNNPFNSYTLTLVVPGSTTAASLVPENGGCNSFESCRTASGYDSPTIMFKNSIYALREIVFHTPSEHTFDGSKAALEVQLVSDLVDCVKCTCAGWGNKGYSGAQWCCCSPNNNDNTRLIQSILFSTDGHGTLSWIQTVASFAKSLTGEPQVMDDTLLFHTIAGNMNSFMRKYFYYSGSISTPPCTSKVQWIIVEGVLKIESEELKAISDLSVGGNARGIQPLNGRTITVAAAV